MANRVFYLSLPPLPNDTITTNFSTGLPFTSRGRLYRIGNLPLITPSHRLPTICCRATSVAQSSCCILLAFVWGPSDFQCLFSRSLKSMKPAHCSSVLVLALHCTAALIFALLLGISAEIKNPLKAVENLHNSAFGNAQETPAAIAIPNQATATMVSMRDASQRPRRMVRKPEHLPNGNNSVTIGIYHRPFPYWRLIVGSKQFQSHRFVAATVAPMA